MKAAPKGYITGVVRLPCDEERFTAKKLQRLALEVKLAFGKTAYVETPQGEKVPSPE